MWTRFSRNGVFRFVLLVGSAAASYALAQNTSGMFLTPIGGAAFSGVIVVQRTSVPPKGGPVVV